MGCLACRLVQYGIVGERIRDRPDAIYALSGTHYTPGSAYRSAGKLSAVAP